MVDTLGFIVSVSVDDANHHDSRLAAGALRKIRKTKELKVCFADQGYRGQLVDWTIKTLGIKLKISQKSTDPNKIVTAKRWIVERTFSWLENYRRLVRDYERKSEISESWVKVAMLMIGTKQLQTLWNKA